MSRTTDALFWLVGAGMISFQSIPQAIPAWIAAIISSTLVVVAWRRRTMPLAPAFAAMMAGETLWTVCAALEPIIVEEWAKRLCIDVRVMGTLIAILGLFAFVIRYNGVDQWLTARSAAIVGLPAIVLILLAWTDPWHHFYFARFYNEKMGEVWIARRTFGPALWGTIAYCYAILVVAAVLLVQSIVRFRGLYRAQSALMLFGVLLPWVVDILDNSGIIPFIPVDVVSPTFALTGLSLLPALFLYHLLDLPPIAWAVVVEGMNDPVVVIDSQLRVVATNPAADRLIGLTPSTITGIQAAAAFSHWPTLSEWLRRRDASEQSIVLDGPPRAVATTFDVRMSPVVHAAHHAGWALVLRDVTGHKNAELERALVLHEQAARTEAEAANRAKDRFLAALSHELRTPLTPILATVTAMLDDRTPDDVEHGELEMIRRNISLEAHLIDDLLDMTRIRSGKLRIEPEDINAHELIHRVVEICREDLRIAQIELVLDLAARRHGLHADPIRMQQVLWNVLKNAIKFTPAGGRVTIRTLDGPHKLVDGARPTLAIEIRDTGIGIEPDALPFIFHIFHQEELPTARRSPGLGLGLMISQSIVEQHGGRIEARSNGRNQGASFRVELPSIVSRPAPTQPAEKLSPGVLIPEQSVTILLVDDNADTLKYLSAILTKRGNRVYTADSVAMANQVAAEVDVDVLVSDIDLPDGSGLDLMSSLHASRGVPGIALSGYGSSDDIELSKTAGFAEHLTKPVDFHTLEKTIHRVVRQRIKEIDSR